MAYVMVHLLPCWAHEITSFHPKFVNHYRPEGRAIP